LARHSRHKAGNDEEKILKLQRDDRVFILAPPDVDLVDL
jgi:hypothetical protein